MKQLTKRVNISSLAYSQGMVIGRTGDSMNETNLSKDKEPHQTAIAFENFDEIKINYLHLFIHIEGTRSIDSWLCSGPGKMKDKYLQSP